MSIQPNKSMIKDVMGLFDAKEIQGKRTEVTTTLNELFKTSYSTNKYFTLEGSVELKEIEVPKSIRDGQIQVQLEAQEAEKAENAKIRMKAQAEGVASKAVIEAQGRATAVTLEAEALAAANKLISASLTPQLLANKAIDRWDGAKSKVQVGGGNGNNTQMLLNLDTIMNNSGIRETNTPKK